MPATPLQSVKNKVIFGTIWFVWAELYFILIFRNWHISFLNAVIDTLFTNSLLALAVLLIFMNLRYYRPKKGQFVYLLILIAVLTALWGVLLRYGLPLLIPADAAYTTFLQLSLSIRYAMGFLILGSAALLATLWYALEDQKEQQQRKNETEKMAREAELYNLRQQLQPHFLFNSLNSISALTGTQPERARKMIQQLSDFLRGTLKKEENQLIPLADELAHLQLYLDIEKVRFGHRLETALEADETALQLKIPSLLLQPVLENAIKFGLYDTTGAVTITLHAAKQENDLVIQVTNPFEQATAAGGKGTGFGLRSVQRRLYLLFGQNDLVSTASGNQLFTTTLKIPQP